MLKSFSDWRRPFEGDEVSTEPELVITHPEKVLFPEDGITKGDVASYYQSIAPLMLTHLSARPVTMERYPNGIGEPGFIQKNVSKGDHAVGAVLDCREPHGARGEVRVEGVSASMKTTRQSAREVPVIAEVDVLVVGSGPGGLVAALASARAGRRRGPLGEGRGRRLEGGHRPPSGRAGQTGGPDSPKSMRARARCPREREPRDGERGQHRDAEDGFGRGRGRSEAENRVRPERE